MKSRRRLSVLALVFLTGVLAAGCGGGSSESGKLTVGYMGWDENVAVSNLTKVLLEEELGYEEVELRLESSDVGALFREVGNNELDAFQDVWLPNHAGHLGVVEDDVDQLDPWFRGTTKFSLAVPAYMKTQDGEDITTIDQLTQSDAQEIVGIESRAVIMQRIPDEVIPKYGLEQQLIEAPTAGMLAEVEKRFSAREPFVFTAWSPHWMNQEYDFNYLEDPKGALGSLTDPAKLSSIVRDDLQEDDPVAYAFINELTMTEQQINEVEGEIVRAGDPVRGVEVWLEDNRDVVQPWVDAADRAREQA